MTELPDAWHDYVDMRDAEEYLRPLIESVFIWGMRCGIALTPEQQRQLREA